MSGERTTSSSGRTRRSGSTLDRPRRVSCRSPVQAGTPADLDIVEVITPPTAFSGQPVDITWMVQNASVEPTHISWVGTTRCICQPIPISRTEGDNILLGTFRHNGLLGYLESYAGPEQGEVALPPDLAGEYYVFVQVDVTDRVFEGEWEDNNVGVAAGTIHVEYGPAGPGG